MNVFENYEVKETARKLHKIGSQIIVYMCRYVLKEEIYIYTRIHVTKRDRKMHQILTKTIHECRNCG